MSVLVPDSFPFDELFKQCHRVILYALYTLEGHLGRDFIPRTEIPDEAFSLAGLIATRVYHGRTSKAWDPWDPQECTLRTWLQGVILGWRGEGWLRRIHAFIKGELYCVLSPEQKINRVPVAFHECSNSLCPRREGNTPGKFNGARCPWCRTPFDFSVAITTLRDWLIVPGTYHSIELFHCTNDECGNYYETRLSACPLCHFTSPNRPTVAWTWGEPPPPHLTMYEISEVPILLRKLRKMCSEERKLSGVNALLLVYHAKETHTHNGWHVVVDHGPNTLAELSDEEIMEMGLALFDGPCLAWEKLAQQLDGHRADIETAGYKLRGVKLLGKPEDPGRNLRVRTFRLRERIRQG